MEEIKDYNQENDYNELINRLKRANESLAILKNNKEICIKDLHK